MSDPVTSDPVTAGPGAVTAGPKCLVGSHNAPCVAKRGTVSYHGLGSVFRATGNAGCSASGGRFGFLVWIVSGSRRGVISEAAEKSAGWTLLSVTGVTVLLGVLFLGGGEKIVGGDPQMERSHDGHEHVTFLVVNDAAKASLPRG